MMKKSKPVHNSDTLDLEIIRLQRAAKEISQQLADDLDKAGKQVIPLTINSIRNGCRKKEKKDNLSDNIFFNKAAEMVTGYLIKKIKKTFD